MLDIANTDDFAGGGGMTRNGRIFSDPAIQLKAEAVAKARGKQPMKQLDLQNANPDLGKDIEEIMKFICKSDFRVIDQLAQTPAKISILSLLRDSEVHRNALMKLLSTLLCRKRSRLGSLK